MTAVSGAFAALLAPGLKKVFFETYAMWPEEYTKINNVDTSERAFEQDTAVAGLGQVPQKNENDPIVYDDPIQGAIVTYTHVIFGLGFRVTKKMVQDDLYNVMNRMSRALSRGSRQTIELQGVSVYNDSILATPLILGQDGLGLIHTAHVLIGGGTYANRPAVDAQLSLTSIQAAILSFEKLVDERGLNIMKRPTTLLIPSDLKFRARELLKTEKKPDTTDNNVSPIADDGLGFMVNHFLSSASAWWMVSSPEEMDVKFYWRQKPNFEDSDDFDTKAAKFSVDFRLSTGFTDWRGVYGTSGA